MSIKLKYKQNEFNADTVIWDRDSFFIDFNSYWSRLIASISQKIAENTTDNWNKFNLIRTEAIKILGLDIETGKADLSSPVNNIPLNVFPTLLASGLKKLLAEKNPDELNLLFQDLVSKTLKESQAFIKDSIKKEALESIKQINKNVNQILITNDSKENNEIFLKESGLEGYFRQTFANINKEQLTDLLKDDSVFITNNSFLQSSYSNKGIKNVLLIDELKQLSYEPSSKENLITINIDGASRGNPGPSSIGIVFYKNNETIKEVSEFLGNHTNNFAEYSALIRALEISLESGYKDIEIKSDSELVVNQINKKYKVKDADIKELFDKAYSIIEKLPSFKIIHVRREENLKADKLANNAFKRELTQEA